MDMSENNQETSESESCHEENQSQEDLYYSDGDETVLISDQQHHPDEEVPPSILPQVLSTIVAAVSMLSSSSTIAYPGVMLPQMMDPKAHDLLLHTAQAALFISLVYIGSMVGSLLVPIPMVRLGQRVTLVCGLLLALISWITLALAPTVWLLLLTRFILGISSSVVRSSLNVYVTELSHPTVRGRLISIFIFLYYFGIIVVYAVGNADLTWRQVALICGTVSTIPSIIGLCFLPNSPRWLATRGRNEEAYKSLVFFRGPDYDSRKELETITEQLERTASSKMNVFEQLREMRKPSILPYVIVIVIPHVLNPFGGHSAVPGYFVVIMNDANIQINSYLCAVISGGIGLLGGLIFMSLVDRMDRRKLAAITCLTSSVSLGLLGMYFFDRENKRLFSGQEWFPIVALGIFITTSLSPALIVLRNEIFPNAIRSTVTPIMLKFSFIGGFLGTETFPYIVEAFGNSGAFWIFSASNLIGIIGVLLVVPETRGRSLEQITEIQRALSDEQTADNS